MTVVNTAGKRVVIVVEIESPTLPLEVAHLDVRAIKVHVIIGSNSIVHRYLDGHRVAGQMDSHLAALELHLVGVYLPAVVTCRSVLGHGVG